MAALLDRERLFRDCSECPLSADPADAASGNRRGATSQRSVFPPPPKGLNGHFGEACTTGGKAAARPGPP